MICLESFEIPGSRYNVERPVDNMTCIIERLMFNNSTSLYRIQLSIIDFIVISDRYK